MTTEQARYYLPEGLSQKELKDLRLRNICAECGDTLAFWRDKLGEPEFLACHRHRINKHEGIARQFTPPDERETLARRETDMESVAQHRELAVKGVPLTGLLTQEQATKILKTIWKGAPETEVYKAALICKDFGLHPLMKHVYLLKYKLKDGSESWVTVLGIGATRLMMSRQGSFSYTDDTPRIMSEAEQIRIFGKVDAANVVAITKLRTKDGLEAQGYGRYPSNGSPMGIDKGNSVENMAFIRAERNAFGRLFPDAKLPSVEVVDEQYMPPVQADRVDTETGEIVDSAPNENENAEPIRGRIIDSPVEAPTPQPPKGAVKHMSRTAFETWQQTLGKSSADVGKVLGTFPGTWLNEHPGSGFEDIVKLCEEAWAKG